MNEAWVDGVDVATTEADELVDVDSSILPTLDSVDVADVEDVTKLSGIG